MKYSRTVVAFVFATVVAGCTNHATGTLGPTTTSNSSSANGATLVIGGSATVSSGSRTQLRAVVHFADGTLQDVTAITQWSSDDPSIVAVSGDGWITGKASGSAEVAARFQKIGDSLVVTVTDSPTASAPDGVSPGGSTPGNNPGSSPPTRCLPAPLPPDPLNPIPCPFDVPGHGREASDLA
jgi:Bacterial Ig-like domain (group 2)